MIAINAVTNQDGYTKEYVPPAQESVKRHGGVYVAAGPGAQMVGDLPSGPIVILRWDSMEALQNWLNSPDFQAALKIGERYAKFNIVAVSGVGQQQHQTLLAEASSSFLSNCESPISMAASKWRTAYSITSSARPSSASGKVTPRALAVLRLMISSTLVARWTGKSAGFSPFRTRPV
jgi:uncharacterized protein (DUF1330 family)